MSLENPQLPATAPYVPTDRDFMDRYCFTVVTAETPEDVEKLLSSADHRLHDFSVASAGLRVALERKTSLPTDKQLLSTFIPDKKFRTLLQTLDAATRKIDEEAMAGAATTIAYHADSLEGTHYTRPIKRATLIQLLAQRQAEYGPYHFWVSDQHQHHDPALHARVKIARSAIKSYFK